MIVRIFRVSVPQDLHEEFETKFLSVSVTYVKQQIGLISVEVGKPTIWQPDEYVMISTWQDVQSLIAFAGQAWQQAVIPDGMAKYVRQCWVHHYEIFDHLVVVKTKI